MSATHACFADLPLAAVGQEGQSALDVLNDDAIRQCRSVSPNCTSSPVPRYERNMGFFRQLSRRFGLRSNDDLVFTSSNEDDNQSSSTDSCSSHTPSSTTAAAIAASFAGDDNKKASEYISCASSETSSTVDIEEQLQRLHLQQKQPPQKQQYIGSVSIEDDDDDEHLNGNDNDGAATNETDNLSDAVKPAYNKERKSFARSSFTRIHRRSATSFRRAFEVFSLSSRSLSCSGVTHPPTLSTSPSPSPSPSYNDNGTPIKSALKSSSNLELNNKSQSSSLRKFSYCSVSTAAKSTASSSSACSSATSSKTKIKLPPQRILRQPVSYTYLKGISGLPTQRVPRNSVCCQYARR